MLTTLAEAARLSHHATGLAPWKNIEVPASGAKVLRVTAIPARHDPTDHDRGPVTRFVLSIADAPDNMFYISGDTEGLVEICRRFSAKVVFLLMGPARVLEVGPRHLTLIA